MTAWSSGDLVITEEVARGIARVLGPERLMNAAAGDPELDALTEETLRQARAETSE